ncbi:MULTISPECIES: hypothetical protein [Aphanizomenon]|uniref:hypothetical protein n=1 Tax=Aphanizomenon TaxID=1175 RepID=UPI000543BB8F|nr:MULTISPECIES: hypothetical protein [Aphanizomenon]KHG41115.1 hypothetical protein OA07_13380 [Aphanizomenon flos-aquae 2012/KM1/D3]MTJ30827.1 hypothetical protein [Aphanizomenon sp. UHCC 0183]QSV71217.1 MAG: hypothetical protein HEQ20_11145 [Aphanizomenon flos-aquae KM1D3_PB]
MVSTEILNSLHTLSRADKLYIMQVLISELAQEETNLIKPDKSYPVWSPYDAFEAANTMLEVLQVAKSQNND